MIPPPPPEWRCTRRIGFLFPRTCGRLSPEGCPDCQNGQIDDPFARRRDRGDYSGDYAAGFILGARPGHRFGHQSADFNEADSENLVDNSDFEDDFSAS